MKGKSYLFEFVSKTVLLFLLLFVLNKLYANDISGYFPLKVGNVWSYNWMDQGTGFGGKFNVRISRDTIINSKKYFLCSGFPTITNQLLRIDSISGNIYSYFPGSCQFSEVLIDSLFSKKYDSTFQCGQIYRLCYDTGTVALFGNSYQRKNFGPVFVLTASSRYYAKGIGLYNIAEGDPYPTTYSLRGCVIDGLFYGDTLLTSVNLISSNIERFSLSQNYPNPFNPKTIITYSLQTTQYTILKVYDAVGKLVTALVNEKQNSGSYEVDFNGTGLPSGVYFYKLEAGDFLETKRMILLK